MSFLDAPPAASRMTFEEANAFIIKNRDKVPAAHNPHCADCVRFTESHGYKAACAACYSSANPSAIANEYKALVLAQLRGCEGYRCK